MADVFSLSFVAGLPGIGQPLEVALVEEGAEVAVTEDNRREYVEAYVDCVLNASIERQARRQQLPLAPSLLEEWVLPHQLDPVLAAGQAHMQEEGCWIAFLSLSIRRSAHAVTDACSHRSEFECAHQVINATQQWLHTFKGVDS